MSPLLKVLIRMRKPKIRLNMPQSRHNPQNDAKSLITLDLPVDELLQLP
jgi:hypothetical protein